MREAAEEVCAALAAVGDCLSLFGWVVGFEAVSVLLTLCAEYLDYDYNGTKVQEEAMAAARTAIFRALEWEDQHQFIVLLLLWGLGLCAWPSLRQYVAERVNWLALAVREEAHDVRINRELRRFEKHCGPQEGLTPEVLLQRDELAQILTDIGYDPEPGQLDALFGAALSQQMAGALSLHWLLQEIEALLGRTDAPTIRQRIVRQQQGMERRKKKRSQRQRQGASPSPAPPAPASSPAENARSPSPSLSPARNGPRRSVRLSVRQGSTGGADGSTEVSGVAAAAATMATLLPFASPEEPLARSMGGSAAGSSLAM